MSDYYLPDEVLIEIFRRLPVKSLLRFRSVSKLWWSLISNPTFITTHVNHNTTHGSNTHLILRYQSETHNEKDWYSLHCDNDTFDKHTEFQPPFEGFNESFRVIGCCNGLICASDDFGSRKNAIIVLWNPSIRKFMSLPAPNIGSVRKSVLGFGFDPVKDSYKVVRIAYQEGVATDPPEVELYELRRGSWRGIDVVAPPYMIYKCPLPADVNGALHWVARSPIKSCEFRSVIVAFDIGVEVFREIMLPGSVADEHPLKISVARSGKSLSLFQYFDSIRFRRCCVWVMKEYGVVNTWSKVCFIDLQGGIRTGLGFRKNGEVLLAMRDRELVSYDPNNGQIRNLGIIGKRFTANDVLACSIYVDSYVESLLLLNRAN